MTGNFNIQLIQNSIHTNDKWIVWKRNIGKASFCSIIPFIEKQILGEINSNHPIIGGGYLIDKLTIDESQKDERFRCGSSPILRTDIFRNFTLHEYMLLSMYLRKYGYIYNKKKDKFIKKEI